MRDVASSQKKHWSGGRKKAGKLGIEAVHFSHFLLTFKNPSDFYGWDFCWGGIGGPPETDRLGSPGVGGNFSWFFWLLAMIRRGDFSCWWLVPWCWRWRYWQGSGAIGKGTCHKFLWKIHHLRQDNPAEGALIMKGGLSWGRTSSWQLDVPMDCQGRFLTLMNKIGHQRQESNQVFFFPETGWNFVRVKVQYDSSDVDIVYYIDIYLYIYLYICMYVNTINVYHYYMQKESLTGFHGIKEVALHVFLCRCFAVGDDVFRHAGEGANWCNKRRNMEDLFSKLLLQVWCQDLTRFCWVCHFNPPLLWWMWFFGIRGSLMPECKAPEIVSWLLSSLFGTWVWILVIECLFLNAGYSWNNCLNKSLVAKKGFWDEEMVYQIRLQGEETSQRDFGKKNTVWMFPKIVVPPNHPF